jgi:general secretion pathway protein G
MRAARGFTLIELVVVLAILGLLAGAARPLLELGAQRQREMALRDALRQIRGAIDDYAEAVASGELQRPEHAQPERPVYPPDLQTLVQGAPRARQGEPPRHFLRRLPRDPFADPSLPAADTWRLRSSTSPPDAPQPGADVFDVLPSAQGRALDGSDYRDW